jgi:ketosteroid isomerase-like protein
MTAECLTSGEMLMAIEESHAAVLAVIGAERAAMESGDGDRHVALLADDAFFMPPNSHAKQGAELRAWLRDFLEGFRVEWLSYVSLEVLSTGDMAYHAYTYTWRVGPRGGAEAATSSGKGVHLLRRQPDGRWTIAREIWNSSPAA